MRLDSNTRSVETSQILSEHSTILRRDESATDVLPAILILQSGAQFAANPLDLVERKGYGHPDKLADDLAETLSRRYANHTLQACGAVLHHNFDKLCLLGGSAEVTFGGGQLTRPIRVLVNGRATMRFAGRDLGIEELLERACGDFFSARFPLLNSAQDIRVELNLSTASSPGGVSSVEGCLNRRHRWFQPRGLDDLPELRRLFANDTSFGSAFAPSSTVERIVRALCDHLSDPMRPERPPWMGTDVKVMACGDSGKVDMIACIPQIAAYVPTAEAYADNLLQVERTSLELIARLFPGMDASLTLNARDVPKENEIYLTAIGTSLESGDEGVVGRGNRVNGLITPLRPMSLEGVSGKNPVYHVGKVYNLLAMQLAQRLHGTYDGAVGVHIVSATGRPLAEPWRILVQMEAPAKLDTVERIAGELLADVPSITEALLAAHYEVS